MNVTLLEEVLEHVHNWFVRDSSMFSGVSISDGALPAEIGEYVSGKAYYRIQGTYLNDGLHAVGDELEDEELDGAVVSLLAIPKPLLGIVDEIDAWNQKYADVASGPYFSEEFGGYKYQIRGFSSYGVSGSPLSGWRLAFANRLNPWRRPF